MKIIDATTYGRDVWNAFVEQNYPPIGAFMQTWEWGEFQEMIGRKIGRYAVKDGGETIAMFTLVHYTWRFGFSYGYIPRGPVFLNDSADNAVAIFSAIKEWVRKAFPDFMFVRMEPPFSSFDLSVLNKDFSIPKYYIQPRFNTAVPLTLGDDVTLQFHSSTRSNVTRAEKRGVSAKVVDVLTIDEYEQFMVMMQETAARNGAKNIYPNNDYLKSFIASFQILGSKSDSTKPSLGIFFGYHHERLAAINLVVFFAGTATYLYGASYTKNLNSKITTYLHTVGMQEAKKRGYLYYDIGAIDQKRWSTLTNFKRQFRGDEFEYIGNIDIPLKKFLYFLYNLARLIK
jgi:lipid II:glycine glycyltransferase (peptidoglycan interpeptide bridge formation enzyme)